MDLVKTLYDNLGVNSVVHTLTNRLPDVIDCDRCTVFVIDSSSDEMWALQGDVNVKFPFDAPGLAPTCGRGGRGDQHPRRLQGPPLQPEYRQADELYHKKHPLPPRLRR